MSYSDVASIATDGQLWLRVLACGWIEQVPDPANWVSERQWAMAASPGWADAWASARAVGVTDLGSDESVITDLMILAAVQKMIGVNP